MKRKIITYYNGVDKCLELPCTLSVNCHKKIKVKLKKKKDFKEYLFWCLFDGICDRETNEKNPTKSIFTFPFAHIYQGRNCLQLFPMLQVMWRTYRTYDPISLNIKQCASCVCDQKLASGVWHELTGLNDTIIF